MCIRDRNNRISGSVEYYHMPTTQMIMNQSLPGFSGFGSVTTNLGEVQNRGAEAAYNEHGWEIAGYYWGNIATRAMDMFRMNRIKDHFESVSYTHLDVYKRQIQNTPFEQ